MSTALFNLQVPFCVFNIGSTTVSVSETELSTSESESIATVTMTIESSSEGTTGSTVTEESTTFVSTELPVSTSVGTTEGNLFLINNNFLSYVLH